MKLVRSLGWLYLVGNLWGHKSFEVGLQHVRHLRPKDDSARGFSFNLRFTTRGDHAGLIFNLCAFGLMFEASLYDKRHWNWIEDRFMLPGEKLSLPPTSGLGEPLVIDEMGRCEGDDML
jgi:hypothetical protein